MKKCVFKKIAASLLAMFLALGIGLPVHATLYESARDGDISLELPDGWGIEEIDADVDLDVSYEKIAETYDDSGKTMLHMDLYFMMDEVADSEYFYIDDSEETAMLYYEEYGMAAIETLYGEIGGVSDLIVGDAVFYDGKWHGFLVVPVTGNITSEDGVTSAFSDTVYLTCEMPRAGDYVVHNLLMFYNENNTPIADDAATVMRTVADGFYDYDYDNIMTGASTDFVSTEWGADDDFFDIDLIIGIVTTLVSSGVVLAVIRKATGGIRRSASRQSSPVAGWTANTGSKQERRQKTSGVKASSVKSGSAKSHDHVQQILKNNQFTGKGASRSPDAEERYMQSLETLRKSGLLTREEMQDMIERHARSTFR